MADNKNAVIVGKVTLQPRKEVVVQKAPRNEARATGSQKPRRQEREVDPRTTNTMMLAELQFVKKALATAKADLANYSNLRFKASELVSVARSGVLDAISPENQLVFGPALEQLETALSIPDKK